MVNQNIRLVVMSREKVWFDGVVQSVTSVNDKGEFDVLAQHENFISIVRERLDLVDVRGNKQQIPIEQGILQVTQNVVRVFLGMGGGEVKLAEAKETETKETETRQAGIKEVETASGK